MSKYERVNDEAESIPLNVISEDKPLDLQSETTNSKSEEHLTILPQWKTVYTIAVLVLTTGVAVLLPNEASEARAACVIIATAALWVTEAIPLMITGLLPGVMFPLVGIMTTKEVCGKYFNYISMLMMGTFLIAEGVEACGLHKRIALKILSILGRGEALLLLGAGLCTWLLSMFMSNTATTAMMLPIVGAIIESLRDITHQVDVEREVMMVKVHKEDGEEDREPVNIVRPHGQKHDSPHFKWFCKGLLLSVPYGASIGGIATLTGTPPNLVLKSIFEESFPGIPSIDYRKWLSFALPLSSILIVVGWTLLSLIYARKSYWNLITLRLCLDKTGTNKEILKWNHVNKKIREKYRELGPFRFPEIVLLVIAVSLMVLWLFRKMDGFDGWAEVHAKGFNRTDSKGRLIYYLEDAWVVIVLALFLFIIPNKNPFRGPFRLHPPQGVDKFSRTGRLLTLDTVMKKTPWDVLFILGGGYAIANGCKDSGLSLWIGEQFNFLKNSPRVIIALVVSSLTAFLTEFASNTASTTLLLPVLISLSNAIKVHPLYLMITGTLSASLAFCLPSATGPNALVFSFKEIRVLDMIRTGLVMNVVSVLVTVAATSTWISYSLDLDHYPCWADIDNITCNATLP